MSAVYNFNAGPAMLPYEVMQKAHKEFFDWHGIGMSAMEISHRSEEFFEIAEASYHDLRELLAIPDNYHVLFLPGGGRSQFAMIPMNLLNGGKKAGYLQTGVWGQLAVNEAKQFCDVKLVADAEDKRFTYIPEPSTWQAFDDCAYLYFVDNETVNGVEFPYVPESGDVPLVCDMSSNILSRPVDISRFGLIFACAQKNMGIAGITLVIIRDDLLERQKLSPLPSMFNYKTHAQKKSLQNTPPTYPWYMAGLVLQWVKQQGGVQQLHERNRRKAEKLYAVLDANDFYVNPVDKAVRSTMNVIFKLPNEALDAEFVSAASNAGLNGLKGHRYLGGLRASLYNAMPEAGVDALIAFMKEFERTHG